MNDQDLLRYSRQIILPEIGIEGQQALTNTTILLIGVGGLGSPAALYLASAGVGHLILADFDQVELSNLQRQIIHTTNDIGTDKVASAKATLSAINPNTKITTLTDLDANNIDKWVQKSDLVLDGTDNFATRFRINQACVDNQIPLVSAAVIRFEGQLSVFKGFDKHQPCYQCLYPNTTNLADESCTNNGILAPVAGVLGTLQALQAIKIILNLGEQLLGKLLIVDALELSFRSIKINKDKNCPICN
ncbi:MAG: molybdopterin-synthase adenylyltransferase MoeB [Candidatus Thioglobus sp.]|nr:MAG: molybdopterin-synthase adenylyltransferase MoeB [Candidatus Thioglobus sp.]